MWAPPAFQDLSKRTCLFPALRDFYPVRRSYDAKHNGPFVLGITVEHRASPMSEGWTEIATFPIFG